MKGDERKLSYSKKNIAKYVQKRTTLRNENQKSEKMKKNIKKKKKHDKRNAK